MRYNKSVLKEKLSNKTVSIGSWVTIPSIEVVEIMGNAGFEWLVIDFEHTLISHSELKFLISSIQAQGIEALVRVSSNEEVIIKKVLDAGANGIIVPMVKSAIEAEKAVQYSQLPPHGKRGVGLNRAQNYGLSFSEYKSWSRNNLTLILQIEHIEGVNNISEIIKTEGVDGVIVGPYDLSASLGHPGDFEHKSVLEALIKVEKIVQENKKSLGFHVISSDHTKTLEKIKAGYNFLAFSIDFLFLGDKIRKEINLLKSNI